MRYFFNRFGRKPDLDLEGLDLVSLDHAKYEAVAFAADTLKHDAIAIWQGGEVRIEVVDSAQRLFFTIRISAMTQPDVDASNL